VLRARVLPGVEPAPHVTIRLGERGIRAVLLDIEGTTTPISFVHDELFPYARQRLDGHLRATWDTGETREATRLLADEHAGEDPSREAPPAWPAESLGPEAVGDYARWLMDRDRKSQGLKLLQGHIWEAGYQSGALQGQVYPDVEPALRRWREDGVAIAIYSSGSEQAQRRLFETTPAGDLTPLLSAFFDTRVGAKNDAGSYARIVRTLGVEPQHAMFVSDVVVELTAARHAGLATLLSLRPGNPPQAPGSFTTVRTFDEIV
jgi:enolase-phosphatase E1